MARPSEYNFDLCIEICELVAKGDNIIKVLDSDNLYPSWSTFRRWKRENDELRTLYINSVQDKAEALENESARVNRMHDHVKGEYQTSKGETKAYKAADPDLLAWYTLLSLIHF